MTLVPPGSELLDIARRELRELLLAELPPEKRYAGLMIANAMAIAHREMLADGTASTRERERLSELLETEGDLEKLRVELAKRIRVGHYTPENKDSEEVERYLFETAERAVSLSNPRHLEHCQKD